MYLENLKLGNFKTYGEVEVDFCRNVNCVVGNNGVGKTNLLDAVYYLSFCKSCFNNTDMLNIRYDEDFFAIHGLYDLDGEKVTVSCVQRRGQPKQVKWNRKVCKTFGEHIGRLPIVMVSPGDQGIILGGSDSRRKFVDGVIAQVDKNYLEHLLQYQKALEQRNRLLKRFYEERNWDETSIAVWDGQLVRHGEVLCSGRKDFMEGFLPLFEEYFAWITDGREKSGVRYAPQSAEPLADQLMSARQHDRYAQYTTVGPHKDDVELTVNGMPVKRFGSQGQQKTFVLALKLAQFDYIYMHCGVKPILLLDDIFDKLDMTRVTQLVKLVGSDRFGQVFLTDTQQGRVERIFEEIPHVEHRIFSVAGNPAQVIQGGSNVQ